MPDGKQIMSKLKISDLTPDDKNYNKGTQFGNSLIEKSLRKFGAGRSILLDKNNRIIAGNKTIENAYTIGLDDVLVVENVSVLVIFKLFLEALLTLPKFHCILPQEKASKSMGTPLLFL